MDVIAGFLVVVSLGAFIVGVVNIIRPMAWMKVRRRLTGVFIVLASMGGCVAGSMLLPPTAESTAVSVETDADTVPAATPTTAADSRSTVEVEQPPRLSGPQRNAVRSARQYLSISGFSRDGLIEQLSSSAGDGYAVADATVAVDSLDVDWNENAARSATQYLSIMGFSCNGLVEQLSSSAGDKYTLSQARFGAEAAGAC